MEDDDLERTDVLPRLGAARSSEDHDDAVPLPFTPAAPSVRDWMVEGVAHGSAEAVRSGLSIADAEAHPGRLEAALADARQARDELESLRAELREQQGDSERLWLDLLRRQEEVDQLQRQLASRPRECADPLETVTFVGHGDREPGGAILDGSAVRVMELEAALTAALHAVEVERERRAAAEESHATATVQLQVRQAERETLAAQIHQLQEALALKTQRLEAAERQQQALRALLERTLRANAALPANPPTLTDPAGAELRATLVRTDGKAELCHVLQGRTRIGRAPGCELTIESASVSRHHAVVLKGARGIIIEDLNSTNGVIVNGRKVTRQLLAHGDMLAIGEVTFRLEVLTLEARRDL